MVTWGDPALGGDSRAVQEQLKDGKGHFAMFGDFSLHCGGLCNVEFGITACRVDGLGLGGLRNLGGLGFGV